MNSTTITEPYSNNTHPTFSEDFYRAFINPLLVVRFYQIGYPITFLLGFLGNTASLITFSRSTLRKVSTGCLFIILAISDTLYLLTCIFDFVEIGLQVNRFFLTTFLHLSLAFFLNRFDCMVVSDTMKSVDFDHLLCTYHKYYLRGY